MSDEVRISYADLSGIEKNLARLGNDLNTVQHQVDSVDTRVQGVGQSVNTIEARLVQLADEFEAFVKKDRMAKAVQLAETRLVKVRQALEHEFGHYGEVRRRTTGILQASDIAIVRQETITTVTEELMMSTPRYWLAPCLVAVAAWMDNRQELAERAMGEAIRRDDAKTSLFFALLSRRLGRAGGCRAWLDRFFSLQDPVALPREAVVLIDALASGVFGVEARGACSKVIESWIEELGARAGFLEEQHKQWDRALRSKLSQSSHDMYAYLPKHSPTWSQLESSLETARLHQTILEFFSSIFSGEILPPPGLVSAVDDLLDKLVTDFDAEELPLRRDERLNTLIIEEQGDEAAAQRRCGLEAEALEERVTFTQLLTNAAMHPETSSASRATQRYAIALSRDWIVRAHADITADNRARVPADVVIQVEDWSGSTRDGSNETELISSLETHFDGKMATALANVKLQPQDYMALVFGAMLVLYGLYTITSSGVLALVLGAAGLGWFQIARGRLKTSEARVRDEFAKLKEKARGILQATIAELVNWRRAYKVEDEKAAAVKEMLEAFSPGQYLLSSHDNSRAVLV